MTLNEIDGKIRQIEFEIELCEICKRLDPEGYYNTIGGYHYNSETRRILQSELESWQKQRDSQITFDGFSALCDKIIRDNRKSLDDFREFCKNETYKEKLNNIK